jgi:hypothetical protein
MQILAIPARNSSAFMVDASDGTKRAVFWAAINLLFFGSVLELRQSRCQLGRFSILRSYKYVFIYTDLDGSCFPNEIGHSAKGFWQGNQATDPILRFRRGFSGEARCRFFFLERWVIHDPDARHRGFPLLPKRGAKMGHPFSWCFTLL